MYHVPDHITPDKPSNEDEDLGQADSGAYDGLERPEAGV
jgi:hypothetical protein